MLAGLVLLLHPSRYYESLGLTPAPERVSGHRRYGADILPRLQAIAIFKQAGCTMAELQVLFRGEAWADRTRVNELAERKLQEIELLSRRIAVMKEVLQSVQRCGCLTLEECPLLLACGKEGR